MATYAVGSFSQSWLRCKKCGKENYDDAQKCPCGSADFVEVIRHYG